MQGFMLLNTKVKDYKVKDQKENKHLMISDNSNKQILMFYLSTQVSLNCLILIL